jgi:hypothetical protein
MKWNIYMKSTDEYLGTSHGETAEEAIQAFKNIICDVNAELVARPREPEESRR